MAGDRIGNRNLLCLMRATYIAVATALAALFLPGRAAPVSVFALGHRHGAGAALRHHAAQPAGRRDHAGRAS